MKPQSDSVSPRKLPVLQYKGKQCFVDGRLYEFRNVKDPCDSIHFGSIEGIRLGITSALVECPHCGQEAVRLIEDLTEQWACFRCGKKYTVTRGLEASAVPPD
jgi:hypothetical protein